MSKYKQARLEEETKPVKSKIPLFLLAATFFFEAGYVAGRLSVTPSTLELRPLKTVECPDGTLIEVVQ